jgi:hypothetical protein
MGIQEQLQKWPKTTVCGAIVLIVAGVVFSAHAIRNGGRPAVPAFHEQAFYTTDEGATLFADSVFKFPPIDHDGASAVRAYVFTCDGGRHQWVQYLEKYGNAEKDKLEAHASDAGSVQPLVKVPGKGDWVPERDRRGIEISTPKCPDGGGGVSLPVFP